VSLLSNDAQRVFEVMNFFNEAVMGIPMLGGMSDSQLEGEVLNIGDAMLTVLQSRSGSFSISSTATRLPALRFWCSCYR
jgi:hypothetical protein